MTGRNNRGRGASNQDADEERRLWKEIKERAKDVDAMTARSTAVGAEIIEVEAEQGKLIDEGKPTSAEIDEKLEKLYRENVKLTEEVQHILSGDSNGMNLLDSIKVLAGLRAASEESSAQSQSTQRVASGKHARPKKNGSASKPGNVTPAVASTEHNDLAHEPLAAPSPRIHLTASRLNAKDGKASRAGSVAGTREPSVKVEQDGAESVASSNTDAPSTATGPTGSSSKASSNNANRATNRLVLRMGEIVFCRHDWKNVKPNADPPEGEGILCRVTNVIGEGKQRRYEVQDADTSGDPPPPQRASVAQLIQIPESNKGLSDLAIRRGVLAQYPDTTTFYKAEVSEAWKGAKANSDAELGLVRLNFQDDEQSREVERRFVLTEK